MPANFRGGNVLRHKVPRIPYHNVPNPSKTHYLPHRSHSTSLTSHILIDNISVSARRRQSLRLYALLRPDLAQVRLSPWATERPRRVTPCIIPRLHFPGYFPARPETLNCATYLVVVLPTISSICVSCSIAKLLMFGQKRSIFPFTSGVYGGECFHQTPAFLSSSWPVITEHHVRHHAQTAQHPPQVHCLLGRGLVGHWRQVQYLRLRASINAMIQVSSRFDKCRSVCMICPHFIASHRLSCSSLGSCFHWNGYSARSSQIRRTWRSGTPVAVAVARTPSNHTPCAPRLSLPLVD
jgi:hypothetical protein